MAYNSPETITFGGKNMDEQNVLKLPDEMLHITLYDGLVRVLLCRTTEATRKMAKTHLPSPTASAALSRIMTGTLMLSVMMKGTDESVTVTFDGNGPAGKIICVGHGNKVKISPSNPQADVPVRQDGHLDVGTYIGHTGRMTVIKDLGIREPYVGQVAIQSGEIGEDFAKYYSVSEQKPSIVALGALIHSDVCLSSGGILVQPLPECPESVLDELELRSMLFSAISREVADLPLDVLYQRWFDGMEPKLLMRENLYYQCDCSREKMERALISMGRTELQSMIEEDGQAELTCNFCRSTQKFTRQELCNLLSMATRE